MSDAPYVLGHSNAELRRLKMQAGILQPITRRLLLEAGLRPGMRVLDIGSGTGELSLMAAEIVGASGSVVGFDLSAAAVETARERAQALGHRNVSFCEATAESFDDPDPFDLVIGRYVLHHQADPAQMIRTAAKRVRPGGVVAFHDLKFDLANPTQPALPLLTQAWETMMSAFLTAYPSPDAGRRMTEHFQHAGLGVPSMFGEVPVGGGPDTPMYAWLSQSIYSMRTYIERTGKPLPGDLNTLEERLLKEGLAAQSQVVGPTQFCAWARC
jgi:ubiquinone/menaquinone biosynthesis C-methylase UbiE